MALAKDSTLQANDRAKQHRERSAQRAAADFTDAASFTEQWADLTAWSSSTAVQVVGGNVQGNSAGGGSGINHSFTVKASERARIVTTVKLAADQGGARLIVGVSNDAPGAAATSSGAAALGMSFTSTEARKWSGGWSAESSIGTIVAGTYVVTVTLDKALITITATLVGGTKEYRTSFPRTGYGSFATNNIFIFNSAATGDTARSIGPLGARKGLVTLAPRAGIEGVDRTVHWTTSADGINKARIALPANYDSRVPSPLVIACHGHGASETMFADDSNGSSVGNALLNAGYIVASTVGNATGTEFGSPKLQDAQAALYKYVRDHYNIGPVMLYGISMGGLGSLMSAVDPRIPGVKAWCASSPITSLTYAYAQTGQGWDVEMRTEYGIAVGGADYAVKTAGSDPMLLPTSRFVGLPMYFIASPSDTIVTKAANTDALITRLTGVTSISTTTATGEHNDPSQYPASKIVAFFDQFA